MLKDDLQILLQTTEGERVLAAILQASNLFGPSYRTGDTGAMLYNEGLRTVGLWLKTEIDKADPEAFARLLRVKQDNGRKKA